MKVRGDLKVLRDLVVKTAANDPKIGKLLYAGANDGTVIWSDLIVHDAESKLYKKGSLVFNTAGTSLYIASVDDAPGINLDSPLWMEISGGSGGSDNVVTFDTKTEMDATTGVDNTIYIVKEFNSLFRWDSNNSGYISIVGIQDTVVASLDVGGIKNLDPVMAGTDLHDFIDQLINPVKPPTKSNNYVTVTGFTGPSRSEVGTSFSMLSSALTVNYNPGKLHSTNSPQSPDIDMTGGGTTHTYSGSNINSSTGAITNAPIVSGPNTWSYLQNYADGDATKYYYDSANKKSDIFDANRNAGSVSTTVGTTTGYYNWWYVIADEYTDILDTSAYIRAQVGAEYKAQYSPMYGNHLVIPVDPDKKGMAFYIPATPSFNNITMLLQESSNTDDTALFVEKLITVQDASLSNTVNYKMFSIDLGSGFVGLSHYIVQLK